MKTVLLLFFVYLILTDTFKSVQCYFDKRQPVSAFTIAIFLQGE